MKNNKNFDLVIICFGRYDRKALNEDIFKGAYEELIREIKANNSKCDITPVIEHGMNNDNYTKVVKALANQYGLDVADVSSNFKSNNLLSSDGLHPTEEGYEVYLESIKNIIKNNIDNEKTLVNNADRLYNDNVSFSDTRIISEYSNIEGFTSTDNNSLLSIERNSTIEYDVIGNVVGISYFATTDGGSFKVYVNDNFIKEVDTKSSREWTGLDIISDDLSGDNKIKIVTKNNDPVVITGIVCSGQ